MAGSRRRRRTPKDRPASSRLRPHRVEHRTAEGAVVLHAGDECFPHHAALARDASSLRLAWRATGDLVLVDPGTGAVVARRRLDR